MGGECAQVLAAGLLQRLHLGPDLFKRLLQRPNEVLHGLVARIEVVLRFLLQLVELSLRKHHELLVVSPQGFGAHGSQLRRQLLTCLDEDSDLLGGAGTFKLEPELKTCELRPKRSATDHDPAVPAELMPRTRHQCRTLANPPVVNCEGVTV